MKLVVGMTAICTLLLLVGTVSAHEASVPTDNFLLSLNKLQIIIYAGLILAALSIVAGILRPKMSGLAKKMSFVAFAVVIIGATGLLDSSIVYANYISPFHGPVHWHAHVGFLICGQNITLVHQELGGDKPMHTHGDELIHIETTPFSTEDVELHHFFEDIGGQFTNSSLIFPSDNGTVTVNNGDLCNGNPGTLKMSVNCRPEPEMGQYVISPVEAGSIDQIVIEFD